MPNTQAKPDIRTVTIAIVRKGAEAQRIQKKLQSEGIESFLATERSFAINKSKSKELGAVKVQVGRSDVQRALNAVDTNRARVEYIEQEYLKNAQESRDIVLESYRLGVANLIDFLDAQRAFRDTQRTYNRALFDQRVSLFELAAAVGRPDVQP